MTENAINLKNTVEAIVFASGEPIDRLRLIEALGCSPERLDAILNEIAAEYDERGSAVQLLLLGSDVQFVTRPEYAMAVRNVLDMKRNQPLSSAGFEVLAIVAYNQPVTRVFVDTLRRVDSSYAMNNLIDRGLIESKGRLDAPGRPMLYGTTPDFLRAFGLSTIEALPQTPEEIKAMFARLDGAEDEADESNDTQISLDEELLEVAPTVNEAESAACEIAEDKRSATEEPKTSDNERSAEDDRFNDDM